MSSWKSPKDGYEKRSNKSLPTTSYSQIPSFKNNITPSYFISNKESPHCATNNLQYFKHKIVLLDYIQFIILLVLTQHKAAESIISQLESSDPKRVNNKDDNTSVSEKIKECKTLQYWYSKLVAW